MRQNPELARAIAALQHGLSNSIAVLSGNIAPLRAQVIGGEALLIVVDIETGVRVASEQFEILRSDGAVDSNEWGEAVHRLANAITTFSANLSAMRPHLSGEGLDIADDMLLASDRARKQFDALRKLI